MYGLDLSETSEMVDSYLAGATVQALSEDFNLSEYKVRRVLVSEGVEIRTYGSHEIKFSPTEESEIVNMYDSGKGETVTSIAKMFECSAPTITNLLKRLKVHNPNARQRTYIEFTEEQTLDMVRQHDLGMSCNALSKRYGVSDSVMLRVLRNAGQDTSGHGRGYRKRFVLDRGLWRTCRALSRSIYKLHRDEINPASLEIGKFLHHVDHKVTLSEGFEAGLTVLDLAHPCNLQILTAEENLIKATSSDMSPKQLIRKIKQWNKDNFEPFTQIEMEVRYAYRYGRYRYFGGKYRHFKRYSA